MNYFDIKNSAKSPLPTPPLKKKNQQIWVNFALEKSPQKILKKSDNFIFPKKITKYSWKQNHKMWSIIYLSKKVGVLWLFYLPHSDLPNHGPNPNALGLLLESPRQVGVHQGGLVMFKPGFCFDPVINLGVDNMSKWF